ncbi:MAG: GNAT family N-acetyltransferase [Xanthomonadales bacterium]|nr:GNAT family N-acetyltransferase [Xanthomonadales bacterium]
MLIRKPKISLRHLGGFDDRFIDESSWRQLLAEGETNSIFLTKWWQKAWWKSFGRGQLLLFGIFSENTLIGLAPLFADCGMVFFSGSGESDYLDFIGRTPNHAVLAELLAKVMEKVPDFKGFRFYHTPDASGTGSALMQAAERLCLRCYDEGNMPAPTIDLAMTGASVAQKKSLVRHQKYFEREGSLSIRHSSVASEILPRLESFFDQHIARWAVTSYPSLFLDPAQRKFYENLASSSGLDSGLRFTELEWNDVPIAFHFGFSYGGRYMWYKPSFAIDFAKHSPGEVLLRSLLLKAIEEDARVFDLGLGAEAFKNRFATHVPLVRTWGLYPIASAHSPPGFGQALTT